MEEWHTAEKKLSVKKYILCYFKNCNHLAQPAILKGQLPMCSTGKFQRIVGLWLWSIQGGIVDNLYCAMEQLHVYGLIVWVRRNTHKFIGWIVFKFCCFNDYFLSKNLIHIIILDVSKISTITAYPLQLDTESIKFQGCLLLLPEYHVCSLLPI